MASTYSICPLVLGVTSVPLMETSIFLLGKLFEIHTLIGLGQFQAICNIPGLDVPAGIEDPQQVINRSQALSTWGRSPLILADPLRTTRT